MGINTVIFCVIYRHGNPGAFFQLVGNFDAPSGIAAVMVCKFFAVDIHIGRRICAIQFQIIYVRCGDFFTVKGFHIHTSAAVIIIAAVLPINGVPSMGKIYKIPIGRYFCGLGGHALAKCPFAVDI